MNRAALADWATVSMGMCAIALTGVLIHQQLARPGPHDEDRQVSEWEEYLAGGHRLGPENAAVVIVEFGDYECPFCKSLEPALRSILDEYPHDVALVYRHKPMPYHANAYQAARLAECAAEQRRFREAHQALYEQNDLSKIDPAEFGLAIGAGDLESFTACATADNPVERVEHDLAAAERFDVTSTPTVLVNGLRLGRAPSLDRLLELVRRQLRKD